MKNVMSKSIERRLKLQSASPSGTPCKAPNLDSKHPKAANPVRTTPRAARRIIELYRRGTGISNEQLKKLAPNYFQD